MKKVFDFKTQTLGVSNTLFDLGEVFIGSLKDGLDGVCKKFAGKKIEVVITEKDFKKIGGSIVEEIKLLGIKFNLITVDEKSVSYLSIKSLLGASVGARLVVGDKNLLTTVRCVSSENKTPCFALLTSPSLENILSDEIFIETDGKLQKLTAKKFEKIIIDKDLILKSRSENFAEAYALSVSKLTALIDYKMGCFLSGATLDGELFSTVQKAVNLALSFPLYENGKEAILASQVILALLNAKNGAIAGLGAECVTRALSVYASESKDCKKAFVALEKTLKLYHMFFTNDFSSLLSVPDYFSDIEKISVDFNFGESFYDSLKIPSEKRRKLILLLLNKTAKDFALETSALLKAFSKIKKAYASLIAVMGDGNVSYKQIKNSVNASAYLTDKTTVYTIMRDLGVLACAN